MSQQIHQDDQDEISLAEMLDFIVENWKNIVLGGVICGAASLFFAFLAPPKYQAAANVQVARVTNGDVEAPSVLLEKLKMPMYYSEKTITDCAVDKSTEPRKEMIKGLKLSLPKGSTIINISFKEKSIEVAKKCLESVLNDIRVNQNDIAKPLLAQKKNQLANLKQKLASGELARKVLHSKNPSFDFSDSKFSASTLLLATTINNENEVQDLRTQINDLEIALVEPQTKEANLTTPIYAPSIRVEPKRTLIVMGSVIGGAVLAIFFLIIRRGWADMKAAKKALQDQ